MLFEILLCHRMFDDSLDSVGKTLNIAFYLQFICGKFSLSPSTLICVGFKVLFH